MGPKEPIGERFVLSQQAKQQVLRLYIRRTKLTGLVACKEDYAPGLFRIPFEHLTSPRNPTGMFFPCRVPLPDSPRHRRPQTLTEADFEALGPVPLQTR